LITEPTIAAGKFTFEFGLFPVTADISGAGQFIAVDDYFGSSTLSAQVVPPGR